MIIYYILVTYGSKSSAALRKHPQALMQHDTYKHICARYPDVPKKMILEYARKINGLHDLPVLRSILADVQKVSGHKVLIDDLTRVFRSTIFAYRKTLLSDLQEFAPYLYSIKHRAKLSEFSVYQTHVMTGLTDQIKWPRKNPRHRDTNKARAASTASRSRKSKDLGARISTLKLELEAVHGKVTLQAVADEANRLGWQTSRGKVWTRQSVKKALDIVAQPECD